MNLDEATGVFDTSPSDRACADLLEAATTYWRDEMIGDAEYSKIVLRVSEWLRDE
jgi:hypothetical protein